MQRPADLHDGVGERVVEWAELFASALDGRLRRVRTGVTWLLRGLVKERRRRRRRRRT